MKKYYILIFIVLITLIASFGIYKSNNKDNIPPPSAPPISEKEQEDPLSPPKVDIDQEFLESLSLDEKIGQLLILGYRDGQPTEKIQDLIENYHIGGVILFNRNYSNIESLVNVTNTLKSWNKKNKLPLFIAIDEEGGSVSRLPKEATKFPAPRILGDIDDPDLTYKVGAVIGKELNTLGINMNFAPVLDIVSNPENKLLYKRAFGGSPETVSKHGLKFIQGLHDEGILSVPKHFPGHGDTIVDSHGALPKIMTDKNTLLSRDIVPFNNAITWGASGIMVGHIAFPLIDDTQLPATKSEIIIQDILRKHLEYKELVITDDIEMLGYAKDKKQLTTGVIQSLQAGVDLFIIGHTYDTQIEVISTIKKAVENNIISEERLNKSVMRIIKAKNKYGIDNTIADLEEVKKVINSQKHENVFNEVKRRH